MVWTFMFSLKFRLVILTSLITGSRKLPWVETEWDGGGNQTWVIPALAKSGTKLMRELYHPPCLLLDSQLNPWQIKIKNYRKTTFFFSISQHVQL